MTLNQMALSTGALAPAVATSMAFDPIASVVLGVTLLDESIHETTLGAIATLAALAAALVGHRDPRAVAERAARRRNRSRAPATPEDRDADAALAAAPS